MRWSERPYVVEIAVPERGLPGTVAMYYFHAREDIQPHMDHRKSEKMAAVMSAGVLPISPPRRSSLASLVVR